MKEARLLRLRLVPFSLEYLRDSWTWLNDPETKHLTMTPDFTRDDQLRFYESLPRDDYRIWGLELDDGSRVGAAGLKHIRGHIAEYWGYIGDPAQRGKGLGTQMLSLVEQQARALGIRTLYLTVQDFNVVALRLYESAGYKEWKRANHVLQMSKAMQDRSVRLVPFDRNYLDRSWDWLRDPEVKQLTMAGDFTREDQLAFFDALPERQDYKIWGVEAANGEPIGAGGIKHIEGSSGEFWCYIGERSWWGQGIGGEILDLCEEKALELGLNQLTMTALETNERSLKAYQKMGFEFRSRDEKKGTVTLEKAVGI